ncbi:hypothetical protein QJS10_CPB22g00597 [Acorus calamus]|uniref:SAM domain-containing protein n=1 Tax=Acorus calamus TaxID=4465 RepID=A0AAV9BYW2_ACOCL|nr:hypothetical protein QJS10_CPB22g00597 [Acorus calamus]
MSNLPPAMDAPANGVPDATDSLPLPGLPTKRHSRPSVRLGEIGAQSAASSAVAAVIPSKQSSYSRRPKQWKLPPFPPPPPDGDALDLDDHRRIPLARRGGGSKRVRTNWGKVRSNGGEDAEVDGEGEGEWESPMRSAEEDCRDWKERSDDGRWRSIDHGGVRGWLGGLGLGRYGPVFEVHEVDEEVLPLLTLEDLKDMGISAVGSRRKMFCAIQKLGKGYA